MIRSAINEYKFRTYIKLQKRFEYFTLQEIYNIGSGRPIFFADMLFLAYKILGSKSVIHEVGASTYDFYMDVSKSLSHGLIIKSSPYGRLARMLLDD